MAGADIEQWGGHTTYDSIVKTGMPGLPYWDGVDSPSCLRSLLQVRLDPNRESRRPYVLSCWTCTSETHDDWILESLPLLALEHTL